MKTVHKFPFHITDTQSLQMPAGAEIVMVGMQGDTPCLWAIVDTNRLNVQVVIHVRGTGHLIQEGLKHVGSFQMPPFVWHVFTEV